jgi:putative FmdB family regulatory protein
MPQYDFRCIACDEVFPLERPLGYLEDESCPFCGSVARRVFQVFEKQPELGGGACSSHQENDIMLPEGL